MKEKYLYSVRALLDCPPEERDRLLSRLDSAVTAYLEDVPEAGEADLTANFGTPEACAARLLEECSPAAIWAERRKGVRRHRILLSVLALLVISLVGLTAYFVVHHGGVVLVYDSEPIEDWTPVRYNSKGESYGTMVQAQTQGIELDLIAVYIEGQDGYIRESDTVWGKWKDLIHTPEDARKYMDEVHSRPAQELLPLYDSEGNVIGEYLHTNWSEDDFNHSDEEEDIWAAQARKMHPQ